MDHKRAFKPNHGFAIFVLFFGIALLEAVKTKNWLSVAFWIAMGVVFVIMDAKKTES